MKGTGLRVFHLVSAAGTNPTVVKAATGGVAGYSIYNAAAAARKIAFHDTATAPTAGANVMFSLVVPAGQVMVMRSEAFVGFTSGIAFTTTTGVTDADATPVTLNDMVINIFYK